VFCFPLAIDCLREATRVGDTTTREPIEEENIGNKNDQTEINILYLAWVISQDNNGHKNKQKFTEISNCTDIQLQWPQSEIWLVGDKSTKKHPSFIDAGM